MNNEDKQSQQFLTVQNKGELIAKSAKQLPSDEVMNDSLIQEMIKEAIQMLKKSYAPYSGFHVGAALLTKSKKIYTGCNIENATFTPTNCAERTAFFKAVSEGEQEFIGIAVVGGKHGEISDYCPPCGVCRQVMMEFTDPKKFIVILARSENDYWAYTLEDLLPMGFSGKNWNQ